MSHDPLCDSNGFGSADECDVCDLIAQARADEREKAAQRVWAAAKKANGAWSTPLLSLEAVAAARGETCQADGVDDSSARSSHTPGNGERYSEDRIVTVELNEDGLGYIKSAITAAQGEAQ